MGGSDGALPVFDVARRRRGPGGNPACMTYAPTERAEVSTSNVPPAKLQRRMTPGAVERDGFKLHAGIT